MLNEADSLRFERAKAMMRALVGQRVFDAWFIGLKGERIEKRKQTGMSLLLSVATVSPRHSIMTYYMDAVRTACMEVWPDLEHIAIAVRVLGQEATWPAEHSRSSRDGSEHTEDTDGLL